MPREHRTTYRFQECTGLGQAREQKGGRQDPATLWPFRPSSLPWSCPRTFLVRAPPSTLRRAARPARAIPGSQHGCGPATLTVGAHGPGQGRTIPRTRGPWESGRPPGG